MPCPSDRHEEIRRPTLRRRYHSRYMDHEEIEHILHMQWRPLHMGDPYLEDYYYQASRGWCSLVQPPLLVLSSPPRCPFCCCRRF